MARLNQQQMGEIRWAVAVANSQARRRGDEPLGAQIVRFSCRCNCFCAHVDDRDLAAHGLYTTPFKWGDKGTRLARS